MIHLFAYYYLAPHRHRRRPVMTVVADRGDTAQNVSGSRHHQRMALDASSSGSDPVARRSRRHSFLDEYAGARERVVDEHQFTVPAEPGRSEVTFRLQLFTSAGLRPVAVATQIPGEDAGASLTNAAERCAAAVWQRHCPDDREPPIWIAHMIMDLVRDLEVVTFTATPAGYTLRDPGWTPLSATDVDALVGQSVDLERGDFTPPEIEPEREQEYGTWPVVLLPRPTPFRAKVCMAARVTWWRRLGRQLVPRRGGRDCCWYHGGDWHTVNRLAIRLTERAKTKGLTFDDTLSYVLHHPDAQQLTGWEKEALESLVLDTIRPYAPWPRRQGYNNGQHRAQAMLDAGVRRVLIERLHWH